MGITMNKPKIEVRREMIRLAVYFGIVIGLLLLLKPVLGTGNAMILSNSFLVVPMSLSNDYTTKFSYNFRFFSIVYVSLGVAAWIADFQVIAKGIVFFLIILFLTYTLNVGKRKMLYIQFMINFIFMIYNPVYGIDVIIRLIILESTVVAMMIAQWIINRKRYRKTVSASIRRVSDEIEAYADHSRKGISKNENSLIHKNIDKNITAVSSIFFIKFDQIRQWDRGRQYLRLLSVLKRLAIIIYRFNKEGTKLNEQTYDKIKSIIKSIDDFNFEKGTFEKLIEDFGRLRMSTAEETEELFIDNELQIFEADSDDTGMATIKIQRGFNKYRFLFSLKTALMCAVGVVIIAIIGLPYEYWYPINVCVLSQPFSEFGRQKSAERIINTVLATAILFIAFHVTDLLWVHIVVMVALVILGDFIFKFNFYTIYSAFMALLLAYSSGQGGITELSILRILYVAGTSALVMLVDVLVSRRKIKTSFLSVIENADTVNRSILENILSPDFSGHVLKKQFEAKFNVNTRITEMRSYYQDPLLDEYILNEQVLTRAYNVTSEFLAHDDARSKYIGQVFRKCLEENDFTGLTKQVSGKTVYSVLVMYDMYETIIRSEEIIREMGNIIKNTGKEKLTKTIRQ